MSSGRRLPFPVPWVAVTLGAAEAAFGSRKLLHKINL
jgi:hypothetical protein